MAVGPKERGFLGWGPSTGFHRVAYTEWGSPESGPVVVCAHGLTRTGRDFDALARALADRFRVACPDFPGRGRSAWLDGPAGYTYDTYLADMAALIARLEGEEVLWVGTSMGGLVGMLLAAQPRTPIRALVLNDVGPFVPGAALERIRAYVGKAPTFGSLAEAEGYLRQVHAPFGPLTDAQWRRLAEHSVRPLEDGRWALHYDPAIGEALRAAPAGDVDLWPVWERVGCPVLVLRGERSDVLLPDTARAMATRGPRAQVLEIPGVGHAPALLDDEQVARIRRWLTEALEAD
ncbi:MAG: alpha/beta hydrolase [Deferrisomatales bacterium]